jgi:predicted Zn-dependent protease with MMP-like domain
MKRPYRLSYNDLAGINQLTKIFKKANFTIDRLPEIYVDDANQNNFNFYNERNRNIDFSIDILGVYTDFVKTKKPKGIKRFSKKIFTQEGTIILYSKRIEEFAHRFNLDKDAVNFIVLIHELGHWFCHWADSEVHNLKIEDEFIQWNKKWFLGYNLKNRRTEEALANICVHWTLNKSKLNKLLDTSFINNVKKAFETLTPKHANGEVNTQDPYGAYKLLARFKSTSIISKINELRRNWMLNDEEMMAFLCSNSKNINEYYEKFNFSNKHATARILNQRIKSIKLDDEIFTGSVFKPTSESQITMGELGSPTIFTDINLNDLDI